jgi:dUTP pyrophosphatase
MKVRIKIKKLDPNAVIPAFNKPGDGAQDVVAVSCKYNAKYDRFEYGLGFATEIPEGCRGRIVPRSSNTKTDVYLPNSVGLIDAGYRGEWMVFYKLRDSFETLFPTGDRDLNLLEMENEMAPYKVGDRIAQVYLEEVIEPEWEEVDELSDSERGADGGLIRDDRNFK